MMNRIYKILKTVFKNISTYFCIFYLTFQPVFAQTVANNALPTNPNVTSGSATFNQTTNQLTINQATDKLITNWSSFNIGKDATVTFNQPSSLSSALNRVNSNDPSYIFGKLNANGQVILLNQSGVIFGNGAKFDAGSFIASTLNIKDTDFLNGRMVFEKDGFAGSITNEGYLNAFAGGAVALIAPQIINNGTISAESGTAALLSGNKVTLSLNGNKLIKYTIDEGTLNSYIENNGAIKVDEGVIILSAKILDDLSKSVISNSGLIEAKGISTKGGKIILEGDDITLKSTSVVDASGNLGGGEVLIGGDYQGKNPEIRNAKTVTAEKGSITKADAITEGDGGKIIFWSDDRTVFLGEASASGGENSGDGGFGEISGKNRLLFDGLFKSPSKTGKIGNLLLDPTDIVVDVAGTDTATIDYQTPSSIQSSLASAGVTLSATNSIYINSAIAYSGATNSSLTFTAESASNLKDGTIALGANVSSLSGTLGLTFNGRTYLTNNTTLTSNGGNVVFNGDVGGAKNLTVNSGSGSTTFNSNIAAGFSGSYISGTITSTTTITSSLDGPSNAAFKFDFENRKVTNSDGTITFWDNGTTNTVSDYSNTFTSMPSTTGYLSTIGGAFSISVPGGDSLTYVSTVGSGTASSSGNTFTIPSGLYIKFFTINAGSSGNATISSQSYTQDTIGISQSFSSGNKLTGLTVTSGAFTAADIGLANSSTLSISNSGAGSVTGAITGTSATLTKAGAGTLTLTGTNTYTGGTTISAGTLQIGSGGTAGSISGAITDNGALKFNRSDNISYSGLISGTGTLEQAGSGTLTLSNGSNSYSGATTVSAGTLAVTANNALGTNAAGTTVASGATLDLQNVTYSTTEALTLNGGTIKTSTGTSSFAGAIALGGNSTFNIGGTQLTSSGLISGGYSLTKSGAGILVLSSGSSTYSGGTTISAGTLTAGNTSTGIIGTATSGPFGTGSITNNSTLNVNNYLIHNTKSNSANITGQPSPTLSFSDASKTVGLGSSYTNTFTNGSNGAVTYSSSNTGAATINSSTGAISTVAAGTTIITASTAATNEYAAATQTYNLTVSGTSLTNPTLTFASSSLSKYTGDKFTNTLTENTDGTITYSSSNTSVATVNNSTGEVTIVVSGSATITASAAESSSYNSASQTFTVTASSASGSTTSKTQSNVTNSALNSSKNTTTGNKNTPTNSNPSNVGQPAQLIKTGGGGSTGGGGANTGGSANTASGTGQGAGGPGNSTGPGQGAGQGLGPKGGGNQGGAGGSGGGSGGNNNQQASLPQGGNTGGNTGGGAGGGTGGGTTGGNTGGGSGGGTGGGTTGGNIGGGTGGGTGGNTGGNTGGGSGGTTGGNTGGGSGGTTGGNTGGGGGTGGGSGGNNNQQANLPQGGGNTGGGTGGGTGGNTGGNTGGGTGGPQINPNTNTNNPIVVANASNGGISAQREGVTGSLVTTENKIPGTQLVILKPNVAPVVEKGYEITFKGKDEANLRPLDNIDQNYQALGDIIGKTQFQVKNPNGAKVDFEVTLKNGGLEIKPTTPQAAQFAEEFRTQTVAGSVLDVVQKLDFNVDQIKTIFIDFK